MTADQSCLIGLDLGTSSIKGVLLNGGGEIVSVQTRENAYDRSGGDGFVEFDAAEHHTRVCDVLRSLSQKLPDGHSVKAVSFASASGNTLLLDSERNPIRPVISWLDERTRKSSQEILPELDKNKVHSVVGWPWVNSFPLAHLGWLKTHSPDIYRSAAFITTSTSYLYWKLCKRLCMDHSTATTFYLQDQVQRCWHAPFLEALEIKPEQLPELLPTGMDIGPLTQSAAEDTGLSSNTHVVLGSFDHPCASRGSGILTPGSLMLSCGTSWVGFFPVTDREDAIRRKLLVNPFLSPQGPWGALFSIPRIGLVIDEIIDQIADAHGSEENKYDTFNSLAAESKPGACNLELPNSPESIDHWFDDVRNSHSLPTLARGIMERIARMLKEHLSEACLSPSEITMVGGPSNSHLWVDILSETLNARITVSSGQHAGAVGAALLAGIGTDIYRNEQEAFHHFNRS